MSNFRNPHTSEVRIVDDCARRNKDFTELAAKEQRLILSCYHWWRYQVRHNWSLPSWFSTHNQKYVQRIHQAKIWSDAATYATGHFEYI
jgi:hypothetical protein